MIKLYPWYAEWLAQGFLASRLQSLGLVTFWFGKQEMSTRSVHQTSGDRTYLLIVMSWGYVWCFKWCFKHFLFTFTNVIFLFCHWSYLHLQVASHINGDKRSSYSKRIQWSNKNLLNASKLFYHLPPHSLSFCALGSPELLTKMPTWERESRVGQGLSQKSVLGIGDI